MKCHTAVGGWGWGGLLTSVQAMFPALFKVCIRRHHMIFMCSVMLELLKGDLEAESFVKPFSF